MELNLSGTGHRWLPRWPGWRRLPRETRDTLFLLGGDRLDRAAAPAAPAAVVLAVHRRSAVVAGATGGRERAAAQPLARRAGARAGGLLTLWSHRTLLGKEAGVTMVVVLMALKTLELRARRDAFVVFFLGFFLVLTQFLYSQSMLVAAAMLVSVWGLLTALVLAHMPVGPAARSPGRRARGARRAARRAGDGGAVRAVPAHRAAVGHAAGREREDRAVRQHEPGRRGRARATTTASRCA